MRNSKIYHTHLYKDIELPFIFEYDQNEARVYYGPYLQFYKVDACAECLLLGSGFHGHGAMGNNRYALINNYRAQQASQKNPKKESHPKHPFQLILKKLFTPTKNS